MNTVFVMFSSWESENLLERKDIYIRQSKTSSCLIYTHPVHSGPFPLAFLLLFESIMFLSSSDPLHMLSLVNSYFSIRFQFKYCFLKGFPGTSLKQNLN